MKMGTETSVKFGVKIVALSYSQANWIQVATAVPVFLP